MPTSQFSSLLLIMTYLIFSTPSPYCQVKNDWSRLSGEVLWLLLVPLVLFFMSGRPSVIRNSPLLTHHSFHLSWQSQLTNLSSTISQCVSHAISAILHIHRLWYLSTCWKERPFKTGHFKQTSYYLILLPTSFHTIALQPTKWSQSHKRISPTSL